MPHVVVRPSVNITDHLTTLMSDIKQNSALGNSSTVSHLKTG